MQYVIGIDGGGTKTLMRIADLQGNMIAAFEGGPSNINSMGRQEVEDILKKLILDGIKTISEAPHNCRAICLGTAGAGREAERKVLQEIIYSTGCSGHIIVTDDARIALYGGVGGGIGVIVIAGTGSICYGRNAKGESHRAGGWGHIIGDEGSGYYIGKKILTHIMRSYDGREGDTALTSLVLKHLNIENAQGLIQYVYRNGTGKKEIADLAKFADDACMLGDDTALHILKDAANELFLCARTVINKLGFADKPVTMAVSGSILTKSSYVRNEFFALVNKSYPLIDISDIKNDAAWGAVLMALDKINRTE